MSEKAGVLVHGATGFTGGLVCELLSKRGMTYAISGRSRERLESLRRRLEGAGGAPPVELCVVDLERADTINAAIDGRKIVLACAGPFALVGEPILAACARLGVHYADTTGEQRFVADAAKNHQSTCEASGACIVPVDGLRDRALRLGVSSRCRARRRRARHHRRLLRESPRRRGAAVRTASATTRGTKKSILGVLAERAPLQWIDGSLVVERSAEKMTSFALPNGRRLAAASFPSPEAIVVPAAHRRTHRPHVHGDERGRRAHAASRSASSRPRSFARHALARRALARAQPAEGPRASERDGTFTDPRRGHEGQRALRESR